MSAEILESNFRNALYENNYSLSMDFLCQLLGIDFEKYSGFVYSTKIKKNKQSVPLFARNQNEKLIHAFWDSELLTKYGYKLCNMPKKGESFARVAMKKDNIAISIIRQGICSDPEGVLVLIRNQLLIKNLTLWEKTTEVLASSNNQEVKDFLEQSTVLNNAYKVVLNQIKKQDSLLSKLKPETLLVSYAIFLEYLYFKAPNDQAFNIEKESYLPVFVKVLQRKNELFFQNKSKCTNNPKLSFSDSALDRAFLDSIKRLKNNKQLDAFNIFETYDRLIDIEFMIERFCLNDWAFKMEESDPTLRPKDPLQLQDWNRTNLKFRILHTFYDIYPFIFNKQLAEDIKRTHFPNIESMQWVVQKYSFITFLIDYIGDAPIRHKDKNIDLKRVFPNFSMFTACYHAQYCTPMRKRKHDGVSWKEAISEGSIQDCLKNAIQGKGYSPTISIRSYNDLLKVIQNLDESNGFIYDQETAEFTIDLMSEEVNDGYLKDAQFLKYSDDKYAVIPRLFREDTRTTLFNALVRWNYNNNKSLSEHMEINIQNLFKNQGYSTCHSWEYKDSTGITKGEADILAYKDGVLLVIEAKLTYFRDSLLSIEQHKSQLKKGNDQLLAVVNALKDNENEVQSLLNIQAPIDDIKIVPLLVSTTPEYDGSDIFNVRKTSLFELYLLLDPARFQDLYLHCEFQKKYEDSFSKEYPHTNLGDFCKLNPETATEFLQGIDNKKDEDIFDKVYSNLGFLHSASETPTGLIDALDKQTVWELLLEDELRTDKGFYYKTVALSDGKKYRYAV